MGRLPACDNGLLDVTPARRLADRASYMVRNTTLYTAYPQSNAPLAITTPTVRFLQTQS